MKRGGGSTLPGRLSRRCAEIVGSIGEEELYNLLRDSDGWGSERADEFGGGLEELEG